MALFFKDRLPDSIHGENVRYYDAIGNTGTVKLSDFKLVLKNNIPSDRLGDPVSAGNLNFASGNALLPCGSPSETHIGDILSMSGHLCARSNTKRTVAASGLAYSASAFSYGFLKLSDTRLLLMYADRMVVATVNFNSKTVSFGAYTSTNSDNRFSNNILIQDQGLAGTGTAIFCCVNSAAPFNVYTYTITGTTISSPTISYNFPSTHTKITNAVSVGSSSFLICSNTGTTSTSNHASLFGYENGALTLKNQVAIPAITGNVVFGNNLFCLDNTAGKYMLV